VEIRNSPPKWIDEQNFQIQPYSEAGGTNEATSSDRACASWQRRQREPQQEVGKEARIGRASSTKSIAWSPCLIFNTKSCKHKTQRNEEKSESKINKLKRRN